MVNIVPIVNQRLDVLCRLICLTYTLFHLHIAFTDYSAICWVPKLVIEGRAHAYIEGICFENTNEQKTCMSEIR